MVAYPEHSEAYYFAPQIGVWEVHQTNDPSHAKVNRQVVLNKPINGGCDLHGATLNVGGDYAWSVPPYLSLCPPPHAAWLIVAVFTVRLKVAGNMILK